MVTAAVLVVWELRPNRARIPSIADEVTTDLITMLSRVAGLRRYGFTDESFVLISGFYQNDEPGFRN